MRAANTVRRASILVLVVCLMLPSAALADTKPYFKVTNGDVFAGGWFDDDGSGAYTSCSSADANYQAPSFNPTKNQYEGGILSYATVSNGLGLPIRQGSSADFGAIALGLIEGDANPKQPANQYGFYSGTASDPTTGVSNLNFSSTNSVTTNYWGGYYAGAGAPQPHCIPDYYNSQKSSSATPLGSASFNIGTLGTAGQAKQYTAPDGQISEITAGGTATIGVGKNISLFINGDAYISHNILYQSGYDSDNTPKLAVVVTGNIYIAPGVTRIDGLFIAQPDSSNNKGDIFTCADNVTTDPDGTYLRGCTNQLSVNGALVAKQVNLLRIPGDVGDNNSKPAETINYAPAMVVGGPFFTSSNSNFTVDNLLSLPPVF